MVPVSGMDLMREKHREVESALYEVFALFKETFTHLDIDQSSNSTYYCILFDCVRWFIENQPLGEVPKYTAAASRQLRAAEVAPYPHYRDELKKWRKAVNDLLCCQCHVLAIGGNRQSFLEVLRAAWQTDLCVEEQASICLSYRKRLGGTPDTFRSRNQRADARRGYVRHRRKKNAVLAGGANAVSTGEDPSAHTSDVKEGAPFRAFSFLR